MILGNHSQDYNKHCRTDELKYSVTQNKVRSIKKAICSPF